MATGSARRARKRAATELALDIQRLQALRAMAERDCPRESPMGVLPNKARNKHFAKRGAWETTSAAGKLGGKESVFSGQRMEAMSRRRYPVGE